MIRYLERWAEEEESVHERTGHMNVYNTSLTIIFTYSVYGTLLELGKIRRRGFKVYLHDWMTVLDILTIGSLYLFTHSS